MCTVSIMPVIRPLRAWPGRTGSASTYPLESPLDQNEMFRSGGPPIAKVRKKQIGRKTIF